MSETKPIACWHRSLIPAEELKLSYADMGVVHGVAITEMLRTFRGTLFAWDEHWKRFTSSAEQTGIPIPDASIWDLIEQMIAHNYQLLTPEGELGVIISATPGLNATYIGAGPTEPTFFAHTFELPAELWAKATQAGQHLAISSIIHPPSVSVPPTIKSRSRINWYLADRDVAQRYPGARAILLDQAGFVRETSTANLFAVRDGRILTAPADTVLPGICRQFTIHFARELGYEVCEMNMTTDDLLQAQELFTTSTPYCLLGVSRLNSASAGLQFPGPVTEKLIQAWNELTGVNVHEQLREIARRRSG